MSEDWTALEKRVAMLEKQLAKIVGQTKEVADLWLKIYENLKAEGE